MSPGDLFMFSVYDSKAEMYLNPIFAPTEAAAVRSLAAAVADRNHDFHRFAEDYSLFLVGEWSPHDGSLKPIPPRVVVSAWTIKASFVNGEDRGATQ